MGLVGPATVSCFNVGHWLAQKQSISAYARENRAMLNEYNISRRRGKSHRMRCATADIAARSFRASQKEDFFLSSSSTIRSTKVESAWPVIRRLGSMRWNSSYLGAVRARCNLRER